MATSKESRQYRKTLESLQERRDELNTEMALAHETWADGSYPKADLFEAWQEAIEVYDEVDMAVAWLAKVITRIES